MSSSSILHIHVCQSTHNMYYTTESWTLELIKCLLLNQTHLTIINITRQKNILWRRRYFIPCEKVANQVLRMLQVFLFIFLFHFKGKGIFLLIVVYIVRVAFGGYGLYYTDVISGCDLLLTLLLLSLLLDYAYIRWFTCTILRCISSIMIILESKQIVFISLLFSALHLAFLFQFIVSWISCVIFMEI